MNMFKVGDKVRVLNSSFLNKHIRIVIRIEGEWVITAPLLGGSRFTGLPHLSHNLELAINGLQKLQEIYESKV